MTSKAGTSDLLITFWLTKPQTHVLESMYYSPILLKNIENKGDFYNGKE